MKKLLLLAAAVTASVGLTGCFGGGDITELEDFLTLMESGDLADNSTVGVSMSFGEVSMSTEMAVDGDNIFVTVTAPDELTGEVTTIESYQEFKNDKYYNYSKVDTTWYVQEISVWEAVDLTDVLMMDLEGVEASDFSYKNNKWVITETADGMEATTSIEFNEDGSVKMAVEVMGTEFVSLTVSNVGTTVVTLPTDAVDLDAPSDSNTDL